MRFLILELEGTWVQHLSFRNEEACVAHSRSYERNGLYFILGGKGLNSEKEIK